MDNRMKPFFTVITPTIRRISLDDCMESFDNQTFKAKQQIIMVDGDFPYEVIPGLTEFHSAGERHNDFGNTARNMAWNYAKGCYLIYLDDDNTLAEPDALWRLALALVESGLPDVAFIPMLMKGNVFMPPRPPVVGAVDTGNIVVKREIGQWPIKGGYEADGHFAEYLAKKYDCAYLPELEPIIVMEQSNHGK